MPFTTVDFLDALDLPAQHPYVVDDAVKAEELKEWSIADYFGSVSKNFQKSNSVGSTGECPKFASPPWGNARAECDGATENIHEFNSYSLNADRISFLEEIKPCLVSMFHMAVILWAPVVLFFCIRRLTTPHRHQSSNSEPRSDSSESSTKQDTKFNFGLPSMGKNPLSKEANANQTSELNKKDIMDRYHLSMMNLIANFVSLLSIATPIFSIEGNTKQAQTSSEPKQEQSKSNGSHITRLRSSSITSTDFYNSCTGVGDPLSYVIALLVSAIIMTDAMYVLEFSQSRLILFHILIIAIGMKRLGSKAALLIALPISSSFFYTLRHQDLDLPSIQPGLYYDESNPIVSKAVQNWPVESRVYEGGTPWMITGDVRTGLPFLLYSPREVDYTRRWVPLPDEGEAVILDIAFPESEIINDNATVYLILHGINGHSNEGYVLNFVHQQLADGNIVAVMVTRGLMDSPILGNNLLHFARTSDAAAAAKALKNAILKMRDHSPNGPMLAGVGYSMGAITLANYVALSGKNCDLDVAIGFSGALDTREQVTFERSASLWQPFIAKTMRDTVLGKFMKQIESKFSVDQFNRMMRAKSLVDLDRAFFAPYNGFDSLEDYYSNTGAMGDFESYLPGKQGRIANVSIPLCMVQSLDDPVGTWRSFHDPEKVATTGNGNTMILFTSQGGHVGWPLGNHPRLHGWGWMGNVASSFVNAIGQAHNDVE